MITPKQNKSYSIKRAFLSSKYKEKENQISIVLFPILIINVISRDERIRISRKLYCYLGILTLA